MALPLKSAAKLHGLKIVMITVIHAVAITGNTITSLDKSSKYGNKSVNQTASNLCFDGAEYLNCYLFLDTEYCDEDDPKSLFSGCTRRSRSNWSIRNCRVQGKIYRRMSLYSILLSQIIIFQCWFLRHYIKTFSFPLTQIKA